MEQNSTLMRYLTLGIIISIFFFNCSKINYYQTGEFYFVNNTDHTITYDMGLEKFNIAPRSVIVVSQSQDSGNRSPNVDDYRSPFLSQGFGEPLTIKFDSNKCLKEMLISDHSVLNIKNYIAEKLGERKYKFTYTFTEADYNRATNCP